jgi:hypothetical protein
VTALGVMKERFSAGEFSNDVVLSLLCYMLNPLPRGGTQTG